MFFGPVTLAAFFDAGLNRLLNTNQLNINPERITQLNAEFPSASFPAKAVIAAGTQPIRASTGLELQMFLPVINAPFRIYWAYNPFRLNEQATPPIPITRGMFPAGAAGDYTYHLAVNTYAPNFLLREPRKTFRFTVATTF